MGLSALKSSSMQLKIYLLRIYFIGFPGGSDCKDLLAVQETTGLIPRSEVPWKGRRPSVFLLEDPWTEAPGGYSPWDHKESEQD